MGRFAFESWLYGLLSAFISGGAAAFGGGVAATTLAPEHFNVQHPAELFELLGWTFVFSGLPGFFAYLHQNPLPKVETKTTVETTMVQEHPPALVVKTVETTKTEDR